MQAFNTTGMYESESNTASSYNAFLSPGSIYCRSFFSFCIFIVAFDCILWTFFVTTVAISCHLEHQFYYIVDDLPLIVLLFKKKKVECALLRMSFG